MTTGLVLPAPSAPTADRAPVRSRAVTSSLPASTITLTSQTRTVPTPGSPRDPCGTRSRHPQARGVTGVCSSGVRRLTHLSDRDRRASVLTQSFLSLSEPYTAKFSCRMVQWPPGLRLEPNDLGHVPRRVREHRHLRR